MKLYYSPGSCSLSPHIVARESGIDCELINVNLKTHQLIDGSDYYQLNPLGYVPMLVLNDGQTLREGPVIAQYLADTAGATLLPAAGTLERYRVLEWMNFIATELHKGFSPLFNPATPSDYQTSVRSKLQDRLQWVDTQLADKEFLHGHTFTVADAYLFVVSGWAGHVGVDVSGLGHLAAYRQRIAARPHVQAALRAEGLM